MPRNTAFDDPARVTAIGMLRYAAEFLKAAQIVNKNMAKRRGLETVAPTPVMFLAGRSIELSCKSYLLHCGVSVADIKTHDLEKLLTDSRNSGLGQYVVIDAETEEAVSLLNELYATKQLEYFVSGFRTLPTLGPIEDIANRIVHAVGRIVGLRPERSPDFS